MDRDRKQNEPPADWQALADLAVAGDRNAYGQLARLVTGYLSRWRAFDFRSDWDDIVQDVLIAAISAHRAGRIESPFAFQAFVRQTARFKFIDRIRRRDRHGPGADVDALLERGDGPEDFGWPPSTSLRQKAAEVEVSVREAVASLDPRERAAVIEVHLRGRTYQEAAQATGIPLGTLKRALRTGLARLRDIFEENKDG